MEYVIGFVVPIDHVHVKLCSGLVSIFDLTCSIDLIHFAFCRYESGERSPSYTILKRIATELNSTVDYLIGESA